MNSTTYLHGRVKDAQKLIRHTLTNCPRLKRSAMSLGFKDVEQETLVRILENEPPKNVTFGSAVYRQTIWTVSDMLRNKRKMQKQDSVEKPTEYEMNLSEGLESKELKSEIHEALKTVRNGVAKRIMIHRMWGKKFIEIATMFNTSDSIVSSSYGTSLRHLRKDKIANKLKEHLNYNPNETPREGLKYRKGNH